MDDNLAALARAVVAHIEGDLGRPIPPPGFPDMDAAYVDLFQQKPETIAMARRLLELPRPPTTVDFDERGDPIVSPEEEEYFRLSGALMAAARGRTEPGIHVEVKKVPGPLWLGRAAVHFVKPYWAAGLVAHALIRPMARRAVMVRRRRRR